MRVVPFSAPAPGYEHPANAYLLVIPNGEAVLVDTGPDTSEMLHALEETLLRAQVEWCDIRHILLTHGHYDHFGLAARVVERSGATVWIHPDDRPKITTENGEGYPALRESRIALLVRNGVPAVDADSMVPITPYMPEYTKPVPESAIRLLAPGGSIDIPGLELEVIHTPGHTLGGCCFYGKDLIFTGDTLLPGIMTTPIIEARANGECISKSLVQLRESILHIRRLSEVLMYPGHSEPAQTSPVIDRHLKRLSERNERVLNALEDYPVTAYTIVPRVVPNLKADWTIVALCEILGHLEWLEDKGRVRRHSSAGVDTWERTKA